MRLSKVGLFIIVFALHCVVLLSLLAQKSDAQENCGSAQECQKRISEYESKLITIRDEKNTLSSQIILMDTQISLTTIKISNTRLLIQETEKEINELGTKITDLNSSLDYLSLILINKISQSYKNRHISYFDVFLDANQAASLVNKIKYIQVAQHSDQILAYKLQRAKYTYEEQKTLREEKAIELENLEKTLRNQTVDLKNQKQQKQTLLKQTNNNEKTYQKLLSDAQRQLSSFKSFIASAGAGGVIGANQFGAGSDGAYYSQRDARWANQRIGSSQEIILEVGCLITDIAMVMKKKGVDMTPSSIASISSYFFANTAYMLKPSQFSWPNGLNYSNINVSSIPSELDSGNPVIVGVYAGKYGTHYVTLIRRDGDEYIMHDPYYGPDKKFSEYYSTGSIFTAGVFK